LYGGTERVVSWLTEELIRQGHHVTLFASGDSRTRGTLISAWPTALRLDPSCPEPHSVHVLQMEEVFRRAAAFDVLHFHVDLMHLPLARRHNTPVLTTLHGRLDLPGLAELYAEFDELPLVSISRAQRRQLPHANWMGTVYHGLPADLLAPGYEPGGYRAFLGRISPEKRPDRAIEIARRSGVPLRIAAKVDVVDRAYYDTIAPQIDGSFISYVGEVSEAEKGDFLRGALALLFPIDWPEPFGLAMIEAMACGTPVIAFRAGSVPEVVDEGQSGAIVDTVEQGVACVEAAKTWDRRRCREIFERRFSAHRMASDYAQLYEQVRRQGWRQSS
jgi:glycosyltransferase involved in cell wall biosynthesis